MKKITSLILILFFISAITSFAQQLNIYVSPTGASTGNGTSITNPVSLARAKTIAKTTANKLKTCHIWLMDGIYTYLALDSTDTRTSTAPLTYHSLNKFKAVFQPITPVNPTGLMSIPDSIKNRIVDSVAKTKVKQVSLASYNLNNMTPWPKLFGYPVSISATTSNRQNWPIIYQNSTPLPMARYPNGDSVMRMRTVLINGTTGTGGVGGVFKYRDGRCQYWQQAIKDGLWLRGCWRVPWQMDFVKTDSITLFDSTVYQSVGVQGGIGNKYTRPGGNGQEPYIAVNLLEEIDSVGEWAINFNNKMLYIYPPDSGTLNISSNSATASIYLYNVKYTSLEGIKLDGGSSDGIRLNGCSNITVAGMDISHVAGYGVMIGDGNNLMIRSNDIHEVGQGGVFVIDSKFSADQLILKSCNDSIINNHIYDYAKDVFLYSAAIDTKNAIGCYAAYNNIHGCEHVGVLFGGNNNIFEYNDVSDVVQKYNDMGAFYTAEVQTKRGNKIQRNYIHAMNYCGSGLYSDNNSQGQIFNGNIAANCLFGLQNNFGLFNDYTNNIYFDNYKYQCSYEIAMTDTVSTSSAYTKVKAAYTASAIYQNTYPQLADYFDTVNKAYTSTVWPQINGSVFIGTSVSGGRCISPVVDKSLFLTSGKTNTTYARTGVPFTQFGLICDNNFFAKTTSFKGINNNLLDSLKSTGVFALTASTDWHIGRIGLFRDSIYRPDISQIQTAGVAPSFSVNLKSAKGFISPDTLTITVTVKNPNIKNSYSKVSAYDSTITQTGIVFSVSKSAFDSIVLTGKWVNPTVGKHSLKVHLLDSTLWDFSSDIIPFIIQSSLPITINNFKGEAKGCNALLSWNLPISDMLNEIEVEKENGDGTFSIIKTIKPSTSSDYSIIIPQESTIAQYRLHILNATGNIYSNTISIKTMCGENELFTILPNPVSSGNINNVRIRLMSQGVNINSSMLIYDAEGRLISSKRIIIQEGVNEFQLPTNNLPKGIYLIKLQHSVEVVKLNVL